MSKNNFIKTLVFTAIISAIFQVSAYGQQVKSNFRTVKAVVLRGNLGEYGIGGDVSFELGRILNEKFHFGAGVGVGYNVMALHGGVSRDLTLPVYLYTGYNMPLGNKVSVVARMDGEYFFRSESEESAFFVTPQIGLLFKSHKRSSRPFLLIGYRQDLREHNLAGFSIRFGFRF